MAIPKRIPTDGGQGLVQNPFAALSSEGLPVAPDNLLLDSAQSVTPVKSINLE
jgi:hypothetical protein